MSEGFAFDLGDWFSDNQTQVRRNLSTYFGGKAGDKFSGRWPKTMWLKPRPRSSGREHPLVGPPGGEFPPG
jgi:hypothetical protein